MYILPIFLYQAVADASGGKEILGMRGILFQLFAQASDVHHQRIFVGVVTVAPYGVAEGVKGHDAVPVFIKFLENQLFLSGQGSFPFSSFHGSPVKMNDSCSQL